MPEEKYLTRCRTCGVKAPRLGDGGAFGTPSASVRARLEFDAPTFGNIYAGFAAIGLITPAMDRFLAFLKEHRRHRLEQESTAPDLSCSEPPWSARLEPELTDDILGSYKRAYYGAECTLCNKRYASRQRERLRRFQPGVVGKDRVTRFVEQAFMALGVDCDNTAAPLSPGEVHRLGSFLYHKHPGHPVRICLLADDEARRNFLAARRRRPSVRRPEPPATREAWWAALEQSGWLNEVPRREALRIRRALRDHEQMHGLADAYRILAPAGFDSESIENDGDYRRVVRAYERAASGAFRPTNIRDRLDGSKEEATVSFRVGTKKFSRTFPQVDDYVAEDCFAFLNDVMGSLGTERRFHTLPTGDQTVALVCVKADTFSRAQLLGLIPFGLG